MAWKFLKYKELCLFLNFHNVSRVNMADNISLLCQGDSNINLSTLLSTELKIFLQRHISSRACTVIASSLLAREYMEHGPTVDSRAIGNYSTVLCYCNKYWRSFIRRRRRRGLYNSILPMSPASLPQFCCWQWIVESGPNPICTWSWRGTREYPQPGNVSASPCTVCAHGPSRATFALENNLEYQIPLCNVRVILITAPVGDESSKRNPNSRHLALYLVRNCAVWVDKRDSQLFGLF